MGLSLADEPIDCARQLLDVGERASPEEHELPTRPERNSYDRSCDFTPIECCARRNLERNRSEARENATKIKVFLLNFSLKHNATRHPNYQEYVIG